MADVDKDSVKDLLFRICPDFSQEERDFIAALITQNKVDIPVTKEEVLNRLSQVFLKVFPKYGRDYIYETLLKIANGISNINRGPLPIKKKRIPLTYDLLTLPKKRVRDIDLSAVGNKRNKSNPDSVPKYTAFTPDWIDLRTGICYSFATDIDLVKFKQETDPTAIVFFARLSRDRIWPEVGTKVSLTDLHTGILTGEGIVDQSLFYRKRMVGISILRYVSWIKGSPLYLSK